MLSYSALSARLLVHTNTSHLATSVDCLHTRQRTNYETLTLCMGRRHDKQNSTAQRGVCIPYREPEQVGGCRAGGGGDQCVVTVIVGVSVCV